MAETKFTKGPWRNEGPDMFGDWNILHPADALAVGAVVSNLREPDEVAANAHLIAAAPTMFEALERLSEMASFEAGTANPGQPFWDALEQARAALRKARGEAQ